MIVDHFKQMTDHGHIQTINKLKKEIKVLKNSVMEMQDILRASVNDSLDKFQHLENFDIDHHRFDKKLKTFIRNCKIEDLVK